jgi:hypothetical protein
MASQEVNFLIAANQRAIADVAVIGVADKMRRMY